ncbi:MAG: hypothetical protein U0872_06890 [Planctomycetaceae bacterium]
MKQVIPLVIASGFGLLMIAGSFVPPITFLQEMAQEWYMIVWAISLFIGGANLVIHQLKKISNREAGWGYSAITVAAFAVTVVVGILKVGVPPVDRFPNYAWSGRYLEEGGGLWWLYEFVLQPITSTLFALLAFYVASAAFRAFRAKNAEAIVLLATAFIVLLGQAEEPLRAVITGTPPERSELILPAVSLWIRGVFNTAGQRAIIIGIAMGVAATSLRVLLGRDRSYLGEA